VYDVEFGRREEQQRRAQLLRKLARQIQRDAAEVGVAQQVVQVVRQQLKHETQVRSEHELPLQLHCTRNNITYTLFRGRHFTIVSRVS